MTQFATGQKFGGELCKALGIDPADVARIILEVQAGNIAHVAVARLLRDDQGDGVLEVVSNYRLVPDQELIEEKT
jgi:hypothetical protein